MTTASLFHADPAASRQALAAISPTTLQGDVLASVLAVGLFHEDKTVRKDARGLLQAHGPAALGQKLAGDRRRYHTIQNDTKLYKVVQEFSALGVDAALLAVGMVRAFDLQRPLSHEEALSAALRVDGAARGALEAVAHRAEVAFITKSSFPPHLDVLSELVELRVELQSKLKSSDNLDGLVRLGRPVHLTLRTSEVDLSLLRPAASALVGLSAYGCRLKNVSVLSELTALRSLNLERTDLADLSVLKDLPLKMLIVSRSEVTSLAPIAGMTTLEVLRVSHLKVDLAPLAGLSGLRTLELDMTGVNDLGFVAGMPQLEVLGLWGAPLASLDALAGHPSLRHLGLQHLPNRVDPSPLLQIPSLEWVAAVRSITPADKEMLQAARPGLFVSC